MLCLIDPQRRATPLMPTRISSAEAVQLGTSRHAAYGVGKEAAAAEQAALAIEAAVATKAAEAERAAMAAAARVYGRLQAAPP